MFAKIKSFLSKIGKKLISQTGINIITVILSLTALFLPPILDNIKSQEKMQLYTFQSEASYKFQITESQEFFTVPWQFKVLLANTSSNVITLVNFDNAATEGKKEDRGGKNLVTDVGFLSEKNEKVELPIILQPGEGIVLKKIERLALPRELIEPINNVYMSENGKSIFNQDLTYYDLLYYSVKAKQDVFNNELTGTAIRDEIGVKDVTFGFEGGSIFPKWQPEFMYTFTSAKNKNFKVEVTPYMKEEPSN
ncbi:hypothetical protein [Paenibacillus sp. WLX2291]|uniref:hypothetical protein n=1 Tax=Paenibacillus sp. WLX2291 TaxID=3296934 RepID=UPI00398415B3